MVRTNLPLLAFLVLASDSFGSQVPRQDLPENRAALPAQEMVRLTARSDLVLVPVIVTDKSGQPVSGLQKDAFRIEENGKVRVTAIFEEATTENPSSLAKQPVTEVHSNFLPGSDNLWRMTIVVLDLINTSSMRQLEAKERLVDYLLRSAQRDESMALFALAPNGLRQLHPFTADTAVLIEALQKLKLSLSSEERTQPPEQLADVSSSQQQASDEEQLMSDALKDLDATITANDQRLATRETLDGLTQLARAFQTIPGRKTLLWATGGFPFTIDDPQSFARQGDDLRSEYEEAWRTLNSANIAVYPVDLNEMDVRSGSLPSANTGVSSSQIADMRGTNGLKSPIRLPYDKTIQQRLTLHAFANATGGRACITVAELERCFAQAVDDSRDYYLLGYYLEGDTEPGWRKLKVRMVPEGLHVRYRTEFYVAPRLTDTPEIRRKELVDALASPVDYTGLRLNARLLPPSAAPSSASTAEPRPAEFMLAIMGDSIFIDRQNGNAINLEVTTLAFNGSHKAVASISQTIASKLTPERMQKILQSSLGTPQKIALPPGKYEIKFAVRDNQSGLLGTLSVPLDLN